MQMKDHMVPFIKKQEIEELVASLAKQIDADYEGKELVLVSPLKGSILFVADLARKLRTPVEVEFIQLTSQGRTIRVTNDISTDITNKHVLIVEEIIDAGRKLSFLKNHFLNNNPRSVKVVTLLDKPARRELPIKADYIGKTIEDRYVVGYGMDSEEVGRNYSDIYILNN